MTEIMIEAAGITKVLGEGAGRVDALKGIDLALAGGELTLLMGPSGSGKTTLLSVLGCMLSPTGGSVRIRGQSTSGLGPEALAALRRRHVGFVFQSYHLFPTLTAAENVRLALDVRGDRSALARLRARDALATVGLADKADAFPRELSGGQQQRVAVARAIVGDASVILADEPTAALDSENGHAVMTMLAEIAKDPARALFIVTHDPRIMPFAHRILRIEDGRIVSDQRRSEQNGGAIRALKVAS
jgi:putative ABC transport system ATP-binding protein